MFVSYDLKGIQSFIFSIPRLRYIVGGSALIDAFDRDWAPVLPSRVSGCTWIFSGGGRGVFACQDANTADKVKSAIIQEAHAMGADVAIGLAADFSSAVHHADHLYPYLPSANALSGHPCPESGLYPSAAGGVHPIVEKRAAPGLRFRVEDDLLAAIRATVSDKEIQELRFFRDVSSDGESGDADARAAAFSLGFRNRWAVIVMDGNDMGSQFRVQEQKLNPDKYVEWIRDASISVDASVREACKQGVLAVVSAWWNSESILQARAQKKKLFLPVRPLVVGGDDVIVLCHASYAFQFVQEACQVFETETRKRNEETRKKKGYDLWPATGGKLSISAGILFCPVTLPLATAVPYAESLLASAKGKGRQAKPQDNHPAPPCIDWEQVTESVLDHPALRRQRDFRFLDGDTNFIVELTRRPYTLDEFQQLQLLAQTYASIPGSIRHQVLPSLRSGFHDRQVWRARLGKRAQSLGKLVEDLEEKFQNGTFQNSGRWKVYDHRMSTDVVDALLLLEEQERMNRRTEQSTAQEERA